ncbi:MAG: VOC family protein [Acidimicrobiia bacterium]
MSNPGDGIVGSVVDGGLGEMGAVFDHAALAAPRLRDLLPIYQDLLQGRFLYGGDNRRVGYRALQLAYSDGSRIELMEPLSGSAFFDSFVKRKGWGLHHITFKVSDIRRAIDIAEHRGFVLVGAFLDDVCWKEVFIHPREACGTLVQLAQSAPGYPPPQLDSSVEDVLAGRGNDGNNQPSP